MDAIIATIKEENIDTLWQAYQESRQESVREKLVLQFVPLVKYVIGRMLSHLPTHISRDDLINAGVLGLISAVERFDPERNIKFSTFAVPRIKGAILDELRSFDLIPRSVRSKMRDLQNAIHQLEGELGRGPTELEIAARMGLEIDNYRHLLKTLSPICFFSLSERAETDRQFEIQKLAASPGIRFDTPEAPTEKLEMKRVLLQAIQQLPRNERLTIALYYYEEMTMKEIAVVLKVSESRVSQIHTQAILRLRSALEHALA